jgi:hypothetical protein
MGEMAGVYPKNKERSMKKLVSTVLSIMIALAFAASAQATTLKAEVMELSKEPLMKFDKHHKYQKVDKDCYKEWEKSSKKGRKKK